MKLNTIVKVWNSANQGAHTNGAAVMMFELRAEMYGDMENALIIIIIRWILIYKTKKVSLIYAQVNVECKTLQIATIRCLQLQERQYATFQ